MLLAIQSPIWWRERFFDQNDPKNAPFEPSQISQKRANTAAFRGVLSVLSPKHHLKTLKNELKIGLKMSPKNRQKYAKIHLKYT